jgi:hypothetical protein
VSRKSPVLVAIERGEAFIIPLWRRSVARTRSPAKPVACIHVAFRLIEMVPAFVGLQLYASFPDCCKLFPSCVRHSPPHPLTAFSNPFLPMHFCPRPHQPDFNRGPDVATFRGLLPLAALFARAFSVKGDRPRTHSRKKKIMKTQKNSNSDTLARARFLVRFKCFIRAEQPLNKG